jgi:hypothetical protein
MPVSPLALLTLLLLAAEVLALLQIQVQAQLLAVKTLFLMPQLLVLLQAVLLL